MKIIPRLLIIILIFESCTKPVNVSTPFSTLVTKVFNQDGNSHSGEMDSFQYDNNHSLVKLLKWEYDKTMNPIQNPLYNQNISQCLGV